MEKHSPPGVHRHDLMYVFFFPHRVKLKEGVTFLGARPSNPTQWIVSQDVRSEGHRVVTLHCRRKESSFDQQRSAENSLHCDEKHHFRKMHIVFVVEKALPTLQNSPNPYPVLIRKMWGEKKHCMYTKPADRQPSGVHLSQCGSAAAQHQHKHS